MRRAIGTRIGVLLAAALLAVLLSACFPQITIESDAGQRPVVVSPQSSGTLLFVRVPSPRSGGALEVVSPAGVTFRIPPGHFPPPGQCRVWNPELPPGQQSAPGACAELERRVPAGHYLVYG